MRTALLTSALLVVAAIAWADEPSAPDTKTEAAAETTSAKSADKVAANETTTASIATEDKKILKPPAGYRPKRINGEQVWCAKQVILGSRFPKEDCRNEEELREMIRNKEAMRSDMEQRTKACTSLAGCSWN